MPFAVALILHNRFEIMHAHAQIMQQKKHAQKSVRLCRIEHEGAAKAGVR